jgi:hypothetical protein
MDIMKFINIRHFYNRIRVDVEWRGDDIEDDSHCLGNKTYVRQ